MEDDWPGIIAESLIPLVEAEKNLWKSSHYLYGISEMEQESWNSVTRKMNILFYTNVITVEDVKFTWNSLKESYAECKQYRTATIFSLFYKLSFIDEKPEKSDDYDGLFSRKKGKFLVILHIIVNILFLVLGGYVEFATIPVKEDKLCAGEFIRLFILIWAIFPFMWSLSVVNRIQQDYVMVWFVSIISSVSIAISLILLFTGYDCGESHLNNNIYPLSCIILLTMCCQVLVTKHHLIKLDRPPTMNEMSTVLINELIIAITFFLAIFSSQWTEFYLVMLAWIFANIFIILGYYYICWKHAKILYKFQKRCRLVAVNLPEDPYKISFEREE